MNQRACFLAVVLSTVSMTAFAKAPIGGDTFDSDASAANWSTPFETNFGRLLFPGAINLEPRLAYTTVDPGGPSAQDFAALAWARYDPRPATEWTFQIDVSLPNLSLTAGQSVFFGLEVSDQSSPNTLFSLGYNSRAGSVHEFTAVTPNGTVTRQCTVANPCGTATEISDLTAIRFRFDGLTNTLITEFDPNASDGYSWTTLSTTPNFIPDTVYVFGQSSNRTVTLADNVYGDNVVTSAVLVPEPSTYVMLVLGGGLLGWLTRAARSRVAS